MTEVLEVPEDTVAEMRSLIRDIHQSGYSDVAAMGRFIFLYDDYSDGTETFFESLDSPDIGFEFSENVFDRLVSFHESLGGSYFDIYFSEASRIPSGNWIEELNTLEAIFNAPDIQHGRSYALWIRKHAKALEQADVSGKQYRALLANPQFLSALTKVYDYEFTHEGTNHIPTSWPDKNDGFLQLVLQAVGYKYVNNHQRDWRYKANEFEVEGIVPNLRAIANLEIARKGATKFLSEQYGIRHFNRYPTELLANQFDNKGEVDRPYGVVISAVNDHNGAFSTEWLPERSIPGQLYTQAKKTHNLLVAEAETVTEFEQRLRHFDSVNGNQFKIDFALIETHGSSDSVTFGTVPNLGRLALTTKLKGAEELFSPRSSVVMTGCSTGCINGIAQSLSRQFNTIVVAPSTAARTKCVSVVFDSECIRLIPSYREGRNGQAAVPMVYKNGAPLDPREQCSYLDKDLIN